MLKESLPLQPFSFLGLGDPAAPRTQETASGAGWRELLWFISIYLTFMSELFLVLAFICVVSLRF